jgi:hypothetical protein
MSRVRPNGYGVVARLRCRPSGNPLLARSRVLFRSSGKNITADAIPQRRSSLQAEARRVTIFPKLEKRAVDRARCIQSGTTHQRISRITLRLLDAVRGNDADATFDEIVFYLAANELLHREAAARPQAVAAGNR